MKIRHAQTSDGRALSEIYNYEVTNGVATFDTEIKSEPEILAWLLSGDSRRPTLVATLEIEGAEKVIGFGALYSYSTRQAYADTVENSLYVHPQFRGKGIGKRLLKELIQLATALNLHLIISRITSENTLSIDMHLAHHFEIVGTLKGPGEKFGRKLDVAILQLVITRL